MKNLFISILFLLLPITLLYSQNEKYIITKDDNTIWIDDFKKSSKKNKLYLINNRILADSITALKRSLCVIGLPLESRERIRNSEIEFFVDKIKVDNKILIIYYLQSAKKQIIYRRPSIVPISDLLSLTNILDIKDIESFEISHPSIEGGAIYGTSGRFGVIRVLINKESKFKEIEKIITEI